MMLLRFVVRYSVVATAVLALTAVMQMPVGAAQDADLCDAEWLARASPDNIAQQVLAGGRPEQPCPSGGTPLSLAQRLVSEARSRLRAGEIDSLAFSLALQRLQTLQNPPARSESGASSPSGDLPSPALEDEPEEVRRLRAAAEAGDAEAQAQLGLAYTLGNGVDEHEGEAERWFRRAAEQGHADAQFGLAGVYLNGGRGVRASSVLAHMWFSIAVANGTSQATMAGLLRGLAEREMTSAEINQAIQLARECTASSFQSCEP